MKTKMEKTANKLLRDRVEQQLDWDPEVISTEIGVGANDGVVTLTGFVETYLEKVAAERVALKTYGVRAVANDIVVRPIAKVIDSEIATNAIEALAARSSIPAEKIKVTVKNGSIFLDGEVNWKFQKDGASAAVRHLRGATDVFNRIEIKPRVSTTDVRTKIEEAFRRSAELDARRLSVAAVDGTVELWGTVHSWHEKTEAERAAWAAPGVSKVESHLHVVP
jgi:osmotically-inducible protein OsmY